MVSIGTAATVLLSDREGVRNDTNVSKARTVVPVEDLQSDENSDQPVQDVSQNKVAVPQSGAATATAPTTEQPKYGESPDVPGLFVVFDKDWVMDQAGIAQDDRSHVNKILSGWIYKGSNQASNLCAAVPAVKMQSAGADYMENPVTQLRWCSDYVSKRYGGWQAASEFFDKNRGI